MAGVAPGPQIHRQKVDYEELQRIGRELLVAIGEDPHREGLIQTPRRFASWWREFIEYDPGKTDTAFEAVSTDQMVVVTGMRVWSLCEHHLLPFWCDVSVGYITDDRVLGLSKFARIAHQAAHRPQVQERLVKEIADTVERLVNSRGVAVVAAGQHLCMTMRGVKTDGTMKTSVMRGFFRENSDARREFLSLINW